HHLVGLHDPLRMLHARRTQRHARHRQAGRRGTLAQQAGDVVGGHVALDEIPRDLGGVARGHGLRHARGVLHRAHVLDIVRFDREAGIAQVLDPDAAAAAARMLAHRDEGQGAGCVGDGRRRCRCRRRHRGRPEIGRAGRVWIWRGAASRSGRTAAGQHGERGGGEEAVHGGTLRAGDARSLAPGAWPALDRDQPAARALGKVRDCHAVCRFALKLHILGIAGTFMGGVAALARELGHEVEGSDQAVYPPMSTQLERLGIGLEQGYLPGHISSDCDTVVIGNALSRGNPAVEAVLDSGRAYTSGAQWLSEQVLPGRDVLAVAGTHGKTTTTTILAYLLQAAGREPGFLIGGVADDFGVSARLGGTPVGGPASGAARAAARDGRDGAGDAASRGRHAVVPEANGDAAPARRPLFVVEADEYDTAFFDKRSKFVHYRPLVAILNNLEYDHADIFPDVAAIQRQFHHLVRMVPGRGRLVVNGHDAHLRQVLEMGCWTPVERFGFDDGFEWQARRLREDGSAFEVL